MIYFILLFIYLFIIWGFTCKSNTPKTRFRQCILAGLGLLLLLGLHSPELGVDIRESYSKAFDFVDISFIFNNDTIYGFERGFIIYMAILKYITNDFQLFLFISAIIVLVPILILIYKHSENVMFSIIMYSSWIIYYFSFSGIRQSIAISITVIASIFLLNKKIVTFILFVLLASYIHTSALFFLLVYPLYWLKPSDKKVIIIGSVGIFFMLVSKQIIIFIANLIFGADNRYASQIENSSFGGVTFAIIYLLFVLLLAFLNKNKKNNNHFTPIVMLLCIVQFTGLYSSVMSRIGYYLIPIFILAITNALSLTKRPEKNILKIGVLSLSLLLFFIQAKEGLYEIVPFKFFWE